MSRAETWYTRMHYFFSALTFPSPVGGSLGECFFFASPSSFGPLLIASTLLLPLSPWKPCGSYATFGRERYQEWRRVREEGRAGGEKDEDTVPERDLDAIFKSSTTSIFSLFSPGLSLAVYMLLHPRLFEAEKRRLP